MYHGETERGTSGGTELIPSSGSPSRPVVRWHGGKWLLAPWITSYFPEHRVYVEPFGGGGSVLMRKDRSYTEVYNDLDNEIVNLFRVIRDEGAALVCKLDMTPYSRVEFRNSYDPTSDPVERARRTIVKGFMGFSSASITEKSAAASGFRSCVGGKANPSSEWRTYGEKMAAMIDRLRGVVIENRDAVEVMKAHDGKKTLHYVDPPYVPETRDKGADYRHEMTVEDHEQLAAALNGLDGMVVLSGYRSKLYDELFAGWERVERRAFADHAKERTECLWLRNVKEAQTSLW